MKFEDFKIKVEHWAEVRGIYDQSTEKKQVLKFAEELGEYLIADSDSEAMDAIGDMVVCIINANKFDDLPINIIGNRYGHGIGDVCSFVKLRAYSAAIEQLMGLAHTNGFSFEDCLQMAWDAIKDRKGMMIDGLFVKWENLTKEQMNDLQSRLDSHIEANC
jgi:hypothetical protein